MRTIKTNRLILRNWNVDDYLYMHEFNSEEKVNPSAGCSVIKDFEDTKQSLSIYI